MNKTLTEKLNQFFHAPNGTTFVEGDMLAIKIPVGSEPRYGMILTGSLYGSSREGEAVYPRRDFELAADSYVDNQTGARVVCDSYSPFQYKFSYKEHSVNYADTVSEVRKQVKNYLETLPENRLILAAISAGDDPVEAKALTDYEKKELPKICQRAYALGIEPEYPYNPYSQIDIDPKSQNAAHFAISYLTDKDDLIRNTAEAILPKCARGLLHSQVLAKELTRLQASIEMASPQALQKERSIREAIKGKSSIWATFSNGNDTLRMSIPTAVFTNDHRLSTYQLTTKDKDRLETFLFPDKNQRWSAYAQMDHIVALEYKNKLLYLDHQFYDPSQEQTQEKISVSDRLKDAAERAASHTSQNTTHQTKDRGESHEL